MLVEAGITDVFPAHAGVILINTQYDSSGESFSRTRGGDPETLKTDRFSKNVFPAHAGVILSEIHIDFDVVRFSRTRGGDPKAPLKNMSCSPFFPHTRG